MNKRVNVLISTYNGEKYISEQIDSILNQTYENIRIYVRDDGSTDSTISILEKYQDDGKIKYLSEISGDNLKWGKSFLKLLSCVDVGDYWAFSDQDDVWLPNKIEWAVEWFENNDDNIPSLYHSAYYLMNHDLTNKLGEVHKPKYNFTFQRAITDCLYQGFSIVINRELRSLMLKGNIDSISSHDWWACLLVTQFGNHYYDDRLSSYHRRLDTSMSGGGLRGKIKWFKKTFTTSDSDIRNCATQYVEVFKNKTRKNDLKVINLFIYEHYSLIKSLSKCFYYKRWRPTISSEISIRLLMLLGKI